MRGVVARTVVALIAVLAMGAAGAPSASADELGGKELASSLRERWWPAIQDQYGADLPLGKLELKKVKCPDAKGSRVTCTARLDAQRVRIDVRGRGNGKFNAEFANLLSDVGLLQNVVAQSYEEQQGVPALVVCDGEFVLVVTPGVPVECVVTPETGTPSVALVTIDETNTIADITFEQDG